jgi:hypothetical protein
MRLGPKPKHPSLGFRSTLRSIGRFARGKRRAIYRKQVTTISLGLGFVVNHVDRPRTPPLHRQDKSWEMDSGRSKQNSRNHVTEVQHSMRIDVECKGKVQAEGDLVWSKDGWGGATSCQVAQGVLNLQTQIQAIRDHLPRCTTRIPTRAHTRIILSAEHACAHAHTPRI